MPAAFRRALMLTWCTGATVPVAAARGQAAQPPALMQPPRACAAPVPLRAMVGGQWHRLSIDGRRRARHDFSAMLLATTARWHGAGEGLDWTEISVAGSGEALRTRLVVARLDARQSDLRLDTASHHASGRGAWSVRRVAVDPAVRLAVNAGQFRTALPWGWTVLDGREWMPRRDAPLASTLVIDREGVVHLLDASHRDSLRASFLRGEVRWAFQSYPTLLSGGEVPDQLRCAGSGVDLGHRDARGALGVDDEGRLIVVLTRFDALGASLGALPLGLTVPEMAAVMGSLGSRDAVMLDGGISAQLALRDSTGTMRVWRGLRAVPLGLVVTQRTLSSGSRPTSHTLTAGQR